LVRTGADAGSVVVCLRHIGLMDDDVEPDFHDYLMARLDRVRDAAGAEPEWPVVDDWSEQVPVNQHEVAVFAAFFGDILDDLFGPV
jgi:hypothetical protein